MKLKTIYKILAATGIFSIAAFTGNLATGALWSDNENLNYSYSVSGLETSYVIDGGNRVIYNNGYNAGVKTNSNFWTPATTENTKSKLTELLTEGEAFQLVEADINVYGMGTYMHNATISFPVGTFNQGEILSKANIYTDVVSSPEECGPGFNDNTGNRLKNSAKIVSQTASNKKVYSNDSRKAYLCVGYQMKPLGDDGEHTNTVTALAESAVGAAESKDSWTGQVVSTVPGMDELGEYIDEEVERLEASTSSLQTVVQTQINIEFDPDTYEPSPTFPDLSEGQPVYNPEGN